MHILLYSLRVLSEQVEPFIVATLEMAHQSLREKGCRRFEVVRDEAAPEHFMLYLVFSSDDDRQAHWSAAHHATWQGATATMLAEPAQISNYTQLF